MSAPHHIKLGIPKGSLEEATISLFERAGWKIRKHVRTYFPDINDPDLTARLCRVQEIPGYIRDGVLDVALTGKDWLLETGVDFADDREGDAGGDSPVRMVSDLVYSKVSNRPARWVLAPTAGPKTLPAGAFPRNSKA